MNERETVDNWLADLGVAQLRLDADGVCAFCHCEACEVVIEVPDGSPQLFLYAPLELPAPEEREAFYRHLLELNAYMVGSRGAALGIDPQSGEVVLSRVEPVEALTCDLFKRMLTNFVEAARRLQADLASFRPPAAGAPGAGESPAPLGMIQA